jgi:hypothetical protein
MFLRASVLKKVRFPCIRNMQGGSPNVLLESLRTRCSLDQCFCPGCRKLDQRAASSCVNTFRKQVCVLVEGMFPESRGPR